MAQPQAYNRETDFTERDGDDTNHAGINTELDAAAQSINQIRDNLALIQRDDGALKNGIVTAESLSDSAFNAVLGEVATATAVASASADRSTLFATRAEADRIAAQAAAAAAQSSQIAAASSASSAASSKTDAFTYASNAFAYATTATTKASEASASASSAANSATNASVSATAAFNNAGFSATNAINSANSAITATTQAGIATTQASNAAASATAAAASFDAFDDRYLGPKSAAPTTDNDGNPLLTGALYFDTTISEMRVYTGTVWKAVGTAINGTTNRATYTATAGQTTFAIVYDVGFVDVYLNGLKLQAVAEFTATNGTSIVLATGATAGDVVDIVAYGVFSVADIDGQDVSFIQSGTGAVERTAQDKMRETVSVKDFGAVGDGVTNDTTAVQAAIDYASANNVSLSIAGGYAAYITLKSNLTLIGLKEAKFVRPSGYTGALIVGSGGPFSNITIDGVEFDSGAQTGTVFTLTADLTNVTFQNCTFKSFDFMFDANAAGWWRNVAFDNNTFESNQSVGYRTNLMALGKRTDGFNFRNNRCLHTGSLIHTLSSSSQAGVTSGNVFVEGNYFYKFRGAPYQTRSNGAFAQANFYIRNNLVDGKIVDAAREVHGAFVIAHSLSGITGASWDNVVIDGNTIRNIGYTDNDSEAIVAGGGTGTTQYLTNLVISNNFIDQTAPADNVYTGTVEAIWLQKEGVTSARIFGNKIINASSYAIYSEPQTIDVEIYENQIIGAHTATVDAVNPQGAIQVYRNRSGITRVSDNTITNVGNANLTTSAGIFLTGASGASPYNQSHISVVENNLIQDLRGTSFMTHGVMLGSPTLFTLPENIFVTGNIIRGTTGKEIYHSTVAFTSRTSKVVIKNNYLGFTPNARGLGAAPTPSVMGEEMLMAQGGSVTNLLGGVRSQIVTIFNPDFASTTFVSVASGGKFNTRSGADYVLAHNQTVQFILNELEQWCEV